MPPMNFQMGLGSLGVNPMNVNMNVHMGVQPNPMNTGLNPLNVSPTMEMESKNVPPTTYMQGNGYA